MKSTNGRSASTNCSRGGEGGSTVTFGRQMSLTWTRAHTAPSPQRGEGGGEGVPTSRPEPPHPSPSPLWGEGAASGEAASCDRGRRIGRLVIRFRGGIARKPTEHPADHLRRHRRVAGAGAGRGVARHRVHGRYRVWLRRFHAR